MINNAGLFLNIPRLYTAVAQFLAILILSIHSKKRFKSVVSKAITTLFLIVMIIFHMWLSTWVVGLWIIGMVLSVLLMFLFLITITQMNFFTAGYITIISFVISEFTASIEWQIEYFMLTNNKFEIINKIFLFTPFKNYHLRVNLLVIIIYFLLFALMYSLEKRYRSRKEIHLIKRRDLLFVLTVAILVFTISNISFLNINTPITSNNPIEIFYIRTLVNLSGIIIIYFQREHNYTTQKDLEVYTMKKLLDDQFEKYYITKKNRDLINKKHHDLRNFIEVIKADVNYKYKQELVENLEKTIGNISVNYNTGNEVLDVMLHSKEKDLKDLSVKFTSVIDGKLISFIDVIDIVSIFGNLLDNAIESLKLVEDSDKRLLKLAIFKEGSFVVIKMENYFENKLRFDGSDLLTTKKNNLYHGYGLKNVKEAIEKYGGTLTINTKRNWFSVLIIISV